MCCFSQPVERVEETRIYARPQGERQLIVYELKLLARGDLAMVLPIPVADRHENAITFVDLSSSPGFFTTLARAFGPLRRVARAGRGVEATANLAVHRVGAFEASFVPRALDFDRLDPRFAIPSALWATVPEVRDYGFVVFKLRGAAPEPRTVDGASPTLRAFHPMAFWFPRADRERVFFPTLHVHDGSVRSHAHFDHVLYTQTEAPQPSWERSVGAFGDGMVGRGCDLVLPTRGHRRVINARAPNRDIWIQG